MSRQGGPVAATRRRLNVTSLAAKGGTPGRTVPTARRVDGRARRPASSVAEGLVHRASDSFVDGSRPLAVPVFGLATGVA
jgi:hypothetical protein